MNHPLFFYLKIFFLFFPKIWWIGIVLALFLMQLAPQTIELCFLVINISTTFLFLKLATVIHEYGHLVAARLAGGTPRRMILGIGHEIHRTEIAGVKVILNSIPAGGLAWATFNDEHFIKIKYAAYFAGGVAGNLTIATIFNLLFGFNPSYLSGSQIDLPSAIIFTNLVGLINLLPYYTAYYGPKTPTDGLYLLQLIFQKKEKFKNIIYKNELFNAYEHYEKREYDQAYKIFSEYNKKFPEEFLPLLNISVIHLRWGEIDEALKWLEPLEKLIDKKPLRNYKGFLYNNLAWIHLLKNNIDTAFHYAALALKAMPRSNFVWGTYGAVLIEKGNLLDGMQWLYKNMDLEHPNNITLSASTYLMLAFHQRGDNQEKIKHLNFIQSNIEKLEKDEFMLFERNIEKMGMEKLVKKIEQ